MTAALLVKSTIKQLAGGILGWTGIVTITYHRIGDGRTSLFDRGLWSATPEDFDKQLRWLKAHFDLISPDDIPFALRARSGRHVLITFDDGFRDNFTEARPILQCNKIRATFFVTTGFIDSPRLPWWDEIAWMVRASPRTSMTLPGYLAGPLELGEKSRESAIRAVLRVYYKLPCDATRAFLDCLAEAAGVARPRPAEAMDMWMTWDMLRAMLADGMTIGGHTVSHEILSRMPRKAQVDEIRGCGERLQEELGKPMRTFSYPVGQLDSFNADSRECLRALGVRTAFSYYGGFRPYAQWDNYDIPRLAIEQDMTFHQFRAALMAPWWKGIRNVRTRSWL